jgi:hypothetical protein
MSLSQLIEKKNKLGVTSLLFNSGRVLMQVPRALRALSESEAFAVQRPTQFTSAEDKYLGGTSSTGFRACQGPR